MAGATVPQFYLWAARIGDPAMSMQRVILGPAFVLTADPSGQLHLDLDPFGLAVLVGMVAGTKPATESPT